MEFATEEDKTPNLECSTLILPSLSIGNVGQLAIDLLIPSIGAERIGFLDHPSLLPCVGNDAYRPLPGGDLALPLEAYDSPLHALTLIQQRSPIIKLTNNSANTLAEEVMLHTLAMRFSQGMMVQFAKNLASFAAAAGKKHVVVLSSLDSGKRQRNDVSSSTQIYYLSSTGVDGMDDECEKLGWKRLQEYEPTQKRWKYLESLAEADSSQDELSFEEEVVDDDYYPSLPFAALFSCFKAKGLKVTCLFCNCSEGDNIPDSFQLAEATCKLLGLSTSKFQGNEGNGWVIPFSWKTVYGPPPDLSLF